MIAAMAGRGEGESDQAEAAAQAQRLDKWLWFSRVSKSRTLAARLIQDGKVRVNRARVVKPSHALRAGDVLTIALRGRVRILKVLAGGERRGPPPEAQQLYQVLSDQSLGLGLQAGGVVARRDPGAARPSKRDRRLIERFTRDD